MYGLYGLISHGVQRTLSLFHEKLPSLYIRYCKVGRRRPAKKGAIDGTFQPLLFVDEEEPH